MSTDERPKAVVTDWQPAEWTDAQRWRLMALLFGPRPEHPDK